MMMMMVVDTNRFHCRRKYRTVRIGRRKGRQEPSVSPHPSTLLWRAAALNYCNKDVALVLVLWSGPETDAENVSSF
jgi:hypothetical protein